jgi:transitional endoplasmic reticulum ATPase
LLRAGRFDKLLYIPQPDKSARKRILEIQTRHRSLSADLDLDRIAELTDGLSGAEITSVVNTSVSLVLQEYIAAYSKPEEAKAHSSEAVVTMRHFEAAIRKVKTSREGKPVERAAVSHYR